jgi:hypothetical protein
VCLLPFPTGIRFQHSTEGSTKYTVHPATVLESVTNGRIIVIILLRQMLPPAHGWGRGRNVRMPSSGPVLALLLLPIERWRSVMLESLQPNGRGRLLIVRAGSWGCSHRGEGLCDVGAVAYRHQLPSSSHVAEHPPRVASSLLLGILQACLHFSLSLSLPARRRDSSRRV